MTDTLLQLVCFLPFGILCAALLAEVFVLKYRERDAEPAVLWVLFCGVCAAGVAAAILLGIHLKGGGQEYWRAGLLTGAVAALGSLAWFFKRQARNIGVLFVREAFFSEDQKQPPQRRPLQSFWILSWRFAGLATVLLSLWAAMQAPRPAGSAVAGAAIAQAAPRAAEATPAPAATVTPAPAPVVSAPAAPAPAAASAMADPTRSEMASEAETAAAAAAVAAATGATATPAPAADGMTPAATPAVESVAVVTPPPPAADAARPVSRNSTFATKIRPILNRACIKCHGAQKQKGDLALHTPDAIRAGINGKPAIRPGDPEKSRIYACVILPPDDPDFMPQKAGPLSGSDKKALFDWIKAGADLGDGVSIPGGGDGVFVVDIIANALPDPPQALIDALVKDRVIVRPLSANKRVIEVDFSHSDRARGELRLAELAPLAMHIHVLDLSRTNATDADLAHVAPMRNLSRLMLNRTSVTDAALGPLKANTALETINLYGTQVTDTGIMQLAENKALRKVFLFESKATADGAKKLEAALPECEVSIGGKLEKPPAAPMQR